MRNAVEADPGSPRDRDRWVVARRGPRNQLNPRQPYAFTVENELSDEAQIVNVATIFLTNRECPWRCVMCDLWKNSLPDAVPAGAIPEQIDFALARLPQARQIKLYNSGSFFDAQAIPVADYPGIAKRIRHFERVIVECHPALINERVLQFRDLLTGRLEIALGLETAHAETLSRLNKRMTLEQFATAAEFLQRHQIDLRVFILVKPPFQTAAQALEWTRRSVEFGFNCGASVVSLIPTRLGNGSLEALADQGQFSPPTLSLFESAVEEAFMVPRTTEANSRRVFADLWDVEEFSNCPACFFERLERLRRMNFAQKPEPRVFCSACPSSE